jgi:hypothetical protein
MDIEQGDNGWILRYTGHDCLSKTVVCKTWEEVINELENYFGWYNLSGKHRLTALEV